MNHGVSFGHHAQSFDFANDRALVYVWAEEPTFGFLVENS